METPMNDYDDDDMFRPFRSYITEHVSLLAALAPTFCKLLVEWADRITPGVTVTCEPFQVLTLTPDSLDSRSGRCLTTKVLENGQKVLTITLILWANGEVEVDAVKTPADEARDDAAFDYGYNVLYYEMQGA